MDEEDCATKNFRPDVDDAVACFDNVPVSEAARQTAAPAAQPAAPQRAFYEEGGEAHHSCIMKASGSCRAGVLVQKADTKAPHDESTGAARSRQHDLCLLEKRLEKAKERRLRMHKACTDNLKVRC
jgi:hypothetical protein